MGIGFAVPSNMAHSIMEQLVQHGKVVRGWLGVSIQELTPELSSQFGVPKDTKGVLVSDVMDDSPAKKSRVRTRVTLLSNMTANRWIRRPTCAMPWPRRSSGRKSPSKSFVKRSRSPSTSRSRSSLRIWRKPATEDNGESVAPAGLLADIEVKELNNEVAGRYGLKSSDHGVVVARVKSGSPAEEAGVREGDLVLEVNRKPVGTLKSYERVAASLPKDQAVLLLLRRQGRAIYLTLRP